MLELNQVYQGDCLEVMQDIDDDSIDLTVTSPPYDDLRTYKGSIKDWGEKVWQEIIKDLYRVTKKGGVVVWIVGDKIEKGSETGTSLKQGLWSKECGFNLHDTMIWEKPNFSMPSSNRYHQIFEYMFVLSKGAPKVFNGILDRKNKYGVCFGKNTVRTMNGEMEELKKPKAREYGLRFNVWKNNTVGQDFMCKKLSHPAMFPEQLAKDHIISWSNENDVVLDPMAGSGTVGKAAKNLNRNYILIEKELEYVEICKQRLELNTRGLTT